MADPSKMDPPVARPGKKRGRRDVTLHLRVTQEMADHLDGLAEAQDQSRSDVLRTLLRKGMEK